MKCDDVKVLFVRTAPWWRRTLFGWITLPFSPKWRHCMICVQGTVLDLNTKGFYRYPVEELDNFAPSEVIDVWALGPWELVEEVEVPGFHPWRMNCVQFVCDSLGIPRRLTPEGLYMELLNAAHPVK